VNTDLYSVDKFAQHPIPDESMQVSALLSRSSYHALKPDLKLLTATDEDGQQSLKLNTYLIKES
jgi:hypothetical protein